MTTICAPSLLPSFNNLYTLLPNIPALPSLPSLPTLRSPIFNNLKFPDLENLNILQELQSIQLLNIFSQLFAPMVSFLGISLDSILPKIPGININLIDLLTFNPNLIYDALPTLNLSMFPILPNPMFGNINIPQIQLVNIAKLIISSYISQLITSISGLIGSITNQLHLPGLPTIPTIPTFNELQALMLANFPGFPNLAAILASGISLNALFNFSIPGFPSLPALPLPLILKLSAPEIQLMEAFKILNMHLVMYPMQIIMDFCINTLSILGFSFSALCITI